MYESLFVFGFLGWGGGVGGGFGGGAVLSIVPEVPGVDEGWGA